MQINDVVLGLAAGVGIDLSPDGATAYYVEWSQGELSKVDVGTGLVTKVLGGLSFPQDVKVDWDNGDIFVSERSGAVWQIWAADKREALASPGGAPQQLALTKQGSQRFLYTVGYDSGELVRVDPDAKTMTTIARGLGHPVGIVIDAAQDFAYVTEQDTGALTKVDLANGNLTALYTGLIAPFYLAWNKDRTGIYCVQRDPANSLVRLELGAPTTLTLVANGLAWRPSGVAPRRDDALIYVCSDRTLQVISFNGGPTIGHEPAPFDVYSVSFNYEGSAAIRLKRHETGAMIPIPEYVAGTRNDPVAYVRGSLPHIKVVLQQRAGFANVPYAIGATGSMGGVRRKMVTPVFNAAGLSNPIDFELMWPLPDAVGKPDVTLDWFARHAAAPAIPTPVGSASHRFYIVLARPTAPWDAEPPWVTCLDLACGWASGSTTPDDAAARVTERYNASGRVSYDTVQGATMYGFSTFTLSQMIERLNGGIGLGEKVNCTDSANTVSTLANLVGCELWQAEMGYIFDLNPMIAIGYNSWAIPFSGMFSYHEVAWKGACSAADNVFDGCLKVDADADPTAPPHTPLLATNLKFGDCTTMNYRLRLCPLRANGCSACNPQPGTRQHRPIN